MIVFERVYYEGSSHKCTRPGLHDEHSFRMDENGCISVWRINPSFRGLLHTYFTACKDLTFGCDKDRRTKVHGCVSLQLYTGSNWDGYSLLANAPRMREVLES